MFRLKITFAGLLLAFLLLEASPAFAQKDEDNKKVYRSRQLGDVAFSDGAYEEAIAFYLRYKREAARNPIALNTAFRCLVSAYIRAGYPVEAGQELKEYSAKYPDSDKNERDLFRADIYLLLAKYEEAADIFRELLEKIKPENPLYFQMLSGLGFALMQSQKWEKATESFSLLEEKGKGSKWEFAALKGKIYSMIMLGKLEEAEKLLAFFPKLAKGGDINDLKILRALLSAKKGDLKQAGDEYNEAKKIISEEPYPLLFLFDIFIAGAFMAKDDASHALPYLKDAFIFAPSESERRKTLRMIINAYVASGKKERAVAAAKRYIEYYKNAEDAHNIKLQAARLLSELGSSSESLKLYSEVMENLSLDFSVRLQAAKEAASIHIDENKFDKAEKKLEYIIGGAKDERIKGEGKFLLAELLYVQKKYGEAAKAFEDAAQTCNTWREKSLYWAMRSYYELKEFKKALDMGKTLSHDFPESKFVEETLFFRAMTLEKLGQLNEAEAEFADFAKKHPKSNYAAQSLFEAGKIAFYNKNYELSAKYYSSLVGSQPKSPLAPNALYKRFYCEYLQNNDAAAINSVNELAKTYPESPFTAAALFWMVDYCRELGDYAKCEEILKDIGARFKNDKETMAQALYDIGRILYKKGEAEKALAALKELNEKYPDSVVTSDGLFMSGDILSEQAKYSEALTCYQKAAERRPGSPLEIACRGRIGDCEFSLYANNFDKELIQKALKEYESVLAVKDIPAHIRSQALYKTGKAMELLGEDDKAMKIYKELIFNHRIDMMQNKNINPVWMVKAAHSAIALCLKKGTPKAAKTALDIYKTLIKMNIDLADDYKELIQQIKERYKI